MGSLRLSGRIGALLVAGAMAGLIAAGIGPLGMSERALAQGPPVPGWIQTPEGGWVPPDHPLALAGVPPGLAPDTCGVHTLRGSYVFAASGYNIVSGVPVPKAIVEPIDFHGDGTLTVPAATVSINGTIMRSGAGAGVYTVGEGCGGTLTFTGGPSFDIFVDPDGTQGWMIQTNPNTVFQGTVTRVR